MSNINSLTWELAPHTAAKHTILKDYLQAWMRIMTLGYNLNQRIIYIDGFSGPGEYSKGEDGSPIIALKETIKYCDSMNSNPQIRFIFIEEDKDRLNNLKRKIGELFNEEDPSKLEDVYQPNNYKNLLLVILNGQFEAHMEDLLESVNGNLAPTFAFIDPFGFKSMPFYIIEKLLENDKSEVFINFMYEDINRFLKLPSLQESYNSVFGTKEWKSILDNLETYSSAQRRHFLHTLYKDQLNKAGLKYVISFEMKNDKNATDYFLYYGTNHIKGLEKMKDAMWKVDNSGAYTFSDYVAKKKQIEFNFTDFDAPDLNVLANQIFEKFKGKSVTSETVKDYVLVNTIFRRNVHPKAALKILEQTGKIKSVVERKRKNAYPDQCIITFVE